MTFALPAPLPFPVRSTRRRWLQERHPNRSRRDNGEESPPRVRSGRSNVRKFSGQMEGKGDTPTLARPPVEEKDR
jgi:hypothetical protein